MDRIIFHTGSNDVDPKPPNQPAVPLTQDERMVRRFLNEQMTLEASHIKELRTFIDVMRRGTVGSNDPSVVDHFGRVVQEVLRTESSSMEFKRVVLFIFLSYTAVLEEQSTRLDREQEELKESEERKKKKVKRSIQDDQLNDKHHGRIIKVRYAIIEVREATIESLEDRFWERRRKIEHLDKISEQVFMAVKTSMENKSRHEPRAIRRSVLHLHKIIAALVNQGSTPAQATLLIMSRKHISRHCRHL